jgi:cytidine deaminase
LYLCAKYQQYMENLELKSLIKVCQLDELSSEERHLVELAIEATNHSYSPYSHFSVGAAVRLDNGVELSGSNQENAAYPSGICAERTTLFYAGSEYPDVPVRMLAIAARGTDGKLTEEPTGPCGACRQVILESETRAGAPMRILLYGKKCVYVLDGIETLLPLCFAEF